MMCLWCCGAVDERGVPLEPVMPDDPDYAPPEGNLNGRRFRPAAVRSIIHYDVVEIVLAGLSACLAASSVRLAIIDGSLRTGAAWLATLGAYFGLYQLQCWRDEQGHVPLLTLERLRAGCRCSCRRQAEVLDV